MKKGQLVLTLTLAAGLAGVAWAQDEPSPAPAPVPAFGQENPAPSVAENPPISAIDQPGLDPHASPESFLLYGLHFSQSVDSNVGNNLGDSSIASVTRGLGSVTLQRLWKNYDVAVDYIGGVAYYDQKGLGLEQLQQMDLDNRINWKRGQLAIRDSFSYLPEGIFGFGAYGGGGAYNSGLGSLGAGMLGAGAFGGQGNVFNGGTGVSVGQVPRLNNLGLADVVEELSPKSSVTASVGYAIVHFYGSLENIAGSQENLNFIGSKELTGQFGYDRILTPKDQVALSYGYQDFDFSTVGTKFHTNVIQAMYGHRISGRLNFLIGLGPQFTHLDSNPVVFVCAIPGLPENLCPTGLGTFVTIPQQANHTGIAGRLLISYRFPKTTMSLTYQRYTTSGNGIFAGSRSDIARADFSRPLSRVWDIFADFGFSKNARLQVPGESVSASILYYGYAGAGVHRQLSRSLRAYFSYQFNELGFNSNVCPPFSQVDGASCVSEFTAQPVSAVPLSNLSQRQVGTIGLDWTPRPRRLD
ncbi:MAG TPA: hypothetical protein VND65_03425 [Candidatus Binatia bacterium]|nr:hypothetical protein [Candidatus Binatia bacterium]